MYFQVSIRKDLKRNVTEYATGVFTAVVLVEVDNNILLVSYHSSTSSMRYTTHNQHKLSLS